MMARNASFSHPPYFTLLVLALASAVLYQFHYSHGIVLVTLSVSTILLIIFGEHFAFEDWLESRHIPGRDAILPMIALGTALALGAVSQDTLPRVFNAKIDIICLILSFAIVSEGISRSGYFAFAANKIVAKCHGNTTRLIIYMYILTAVLAFFSSNDIVILVLTPVIVSICVHARIQNARLILLSQFVAANTLSMGTLIGSPTNIIFGNAMHLNFFNYLFMMAVPALLCGMLSLIVMDWINRQSRPGSNGLFTRRWSYEDTYRIPASAHYAYFTSHMKIWLILFALAVVLLAVITSLHVSLLYAALPIGAGALFTLYTEKRKETDKAASRRDLRVILASLPYSILFFSMTFFAFADEIIRLNLIQNAVLPFLRSYMFNDVVHASFGMLALTGGMVNTINDLPSAALLSELINNVNQMPGGTMNEYLQMVVMQAVLVGLNIGCYVTPVGALAGIMWFNIIRREERRQRERERSSAPEHAAQIRRMLTPSRADMVRYGLMHFAFVGFVMGYLLPFFVNLVDILISSPSIANETALPGLVSIRNYLPYIGISMLLFIFITARRVLERSGVLLGHMREVFVVMTRVTIWTMKNRMLYLILLGAALLALASCLLFWAETAHEHVFSAAEGSKPLFDSVSSFFIWVMVFSGEGLSDAYKPHSALGMALTGILPVLVIGGIVLISQLSSRNTVVHLSQRMASGDIPGYRIAIINFHSRFEKLVETMLHHRSASVLLLCNPQTYDHANAFCARLNSNPETAFRVYAAPKHADASYSIEEYRIEQADEIYLLSDMTVLGEYDKIRYATRLDATLNTIRSAMAEGMSAGGAPHAHELDMETLEGVPKIFIESCAARFHGLLQKASSPLFLRYSVQTTFDGDVAELLMSDMDETMTSLNHYYKLGQPAPSPELFGESNTPLEHHILRGFNLTPESQKIFRAHFSGPAIDREDTPQQQQALLMQESRLTRALVGMKTQDARYIDAGEEKQVTNANLYGVVADMSGSKVHLSIPSAALSMQPVNVDRVIMKHTLLDGKLFDSKFSKSESRIYVFNLSQLAKAFVRKLMPYFSDDKEPRIILLCSHAQFIPEDIRNHHCVHVIQSDHIEELVQDICPTAEERASLEARGGFLPVLRRGDRLYGFLEHDVANSESMTIDFMDLLDTRLRKIMLEAVQPSVSHPEIYIAMEATGTDSRFMMKNFFIDKIIDTSVPRINFLEILSTLFHRVAKERVEKGELQNVLFNFRRAAEIAGYLCHFTVMLAEDVRLKDDMGTELTLLGKSLEEATLDMRAYSSPPVQLFERVRVEFVSCPVRVGTQTFRLTSVAEDEPIRRDDLLLNLPVI